MHLNYKIFHLNIITNSIPNNFWKFDHLSNIYLIVIKQRNVNILRYHLQRPTQMQYSSYTVQYDFWLHYHRIDHLVDCYRRMLLLDHIHTLANDEQCPNYFDLRVFFAKNKNKQQLLQYLSNSYCNGMSSFSYIFGYSINLAMIGCICYWYFILWYRLNIKRDMFSLIIRK